MKSRFSPVVRSRVAPLAACALAAFASCGAARVPGEVPVRCSELVEVEGAKLFLLTRGADRRAPVLLWLHGGPGGAERPLFRYFNGALEEHFVVAYWDQRGTGRSFDPDADPRRLTIAQHLRDLAAVVAHLRESLGQGRVALVGHSWGAALALLYARDHADEVSAVVAVAPLVATREAQEAQADFVRAEASRRGDEDTLARLREIGAPPYGSAEKVLAAEGLAERYGGVFHVEPNRTWIVVRGILGGLVTPWEIPGLIRGNQVSLEAMNDELLGLDLARSVPKLDVPVFFLLGRHDRHEDSRIAARTFDALEAPEKELIWFEDSAHNPPFEEPERFDATVTRLLLRRR